MRKLKDFIDLLKNDELIHAEQSYQAFDLIAKGNTSNEDIKDFLLLINKKGINETLLFGAAKAFNERSIKLKAPKNSIDVCGTGGDNSNSLNISTTVAIIIASMGIPVAKHGNKAVSSNSGSADIFAQLGINLDKNKEEVETSLHDHNLAFIFAPNYHPAFKHVAQARKELGVRTIFNFLGPLLNPAQVNRQLIGCSDKKIARIMLKVCIMMSKEKCWVVTGIDGMDEISISTNTVVNKIDKNGSIMEEVLNPEDYGIKKRNIDLIEGKDPKYNAEQLLNLLKGGDISDEKMNAYKDIVSLNCAAALVINGKFQDFGEAIKASKQQIYSGKSYDFLQKYIQAN